MLLLLYLIFSLFVQNINGRNINIEVEALWPKYSTSFILETSEFLFDQSPLAFWKYVDDICYYSDKVDSVISTKISNHASNNVVNTNQNENVNKRAVLESLSYSVAKQIALPSTHNLMSTMVRIYI